MLAPAHYGRTRRRCPLQKDLHNHRFILRLSGATGIAAALRYHSRQPSRTLQTIMGANRTRLALPGRVVRRVAN